MRNVIFVAPYWLPATRRFADAVGRLENVRLLGICHFKPEGQRPDDLARFTHLVQVQDCFNPDELEWAVRGLAERFGPVHRLVGVLENLQATLGAVRDRLSLHGMGAAAAVRFTDKAHMKDALRAADLPCARHALVRSADEGRAFAAAVGFPLVLKPPRGAGCKATYQVATAAELDAALAEIRPSPTRELQAEEFIRGDEHSFDTVCIDGEPRFHSISCYSPGPLDVMRNAWIQWTCLLPRDIGGDEFAEARRVGYEAVRRLGMESGLTHMEWFRRPDGNVAIGEIAARPPGAQIVSLMSYAHDVDFYRVWARAVVDGAFDGPFERKWAVGIAYLRGAGHGRVAAVDGLDEGQRKVGRLVVESNLPQIGQPKFDGYEGDGYAILRDRDTETVRAALSELIRTVRVRYN